MEEFIKKLHVPYAWKDDGGVYYIDLADSNMFAKVYVIISDSDMLNIVDDKSHMFEDETVLFYEADGFTVELSADYKNDNYKIEVKEAK